MLTLPSLQTGQAEHTPRPFEVTPTHHWIPGIHLLIGLPVLCLLLSEYALYVMGGGQEDSSSTNVARIVGYGIGGALLPLLGLLFWSLRKTRQEIAVLRRNQVPYRRFFEQANEGLFLASPQGRLLTVNPSLLTLFGFPTMQELLEHCPDFNHPFYRDPFRRIEFARLFHQQGYVEGFESPIVRHNGERAWIVESVQPVYGETGEVIYYQGVVIDRTEQHETEVALRTFETRMESVTAHIQEGIVAINEQGTIESLNPAAERIFGYAATEIIGKSVKTLMPPPSREQHQDYLTAYLQTGQARIMGTGDRKVHGVRKNGVTFPMMLSVSEMPFSNQRHFIGVLHDLTEREQLQNQMAVGQEITNVLAETTNSMAAIPQILAVLCQTLKWAGGALWTRETPKAQWTCRHVHTLSERHLQEFAALTNALPVEPNIDLPGRVLKTGKPVWATDLPGAVHPSRRQAAIQAGLQSAVAFPITFNHQLLGIIELVSRHPQEPDEPFMRYLTSIGSQIGQFFFRTQAEEDRITLEIQLQQSQKLETMGALAGGIAHDFNNFLWAIQGYTELGLRGLPSGSPQERHFTAVLTACRRAKDLVKQILSFSSPDQGSHQAIDLVTVVHECLLLTRSAIPPSIEFRVNVQAKTSLVMGDHTQLLQALINLCTNAGRAVNETSGLITLSLHDVEIGPSHPGKDSPAIQPGAYLCLSVQDNGKGMEAGVMDRIFEPYFTTKEKGEGTGLGLPVVRNIIRNHGGAVTVQSTPGMGTTFQIYLPAFQGTAVAAPIPAAATPQGHERLLFVDDEPSLCHLGQEIFRHLGYDVAAYTSSLEALNVFRQTPHAFDLLITDHSMPELAGPAFIQAVRDFQPNIPIILCTGMSREVSQSFRETVKVDAILLKPFAMTDIAPIIRQVLEQSRRRRK